MTGQHPTREPVAPWGVLGVSVVLTLLTWYFAAAGIDQRARARFDVETERISLLVDKYVHLQLDALEGVRGLYAASKSVERDEFAAFLQHAGIPDRYPGMVCVRYAEQVFDRDKTAFEQSVRTDSTISDEGYPAYAIHPPGERKQYVVVKYTFPENEFLSMAGFDLATDPVRQRALELSQRSGRSQATASYVRSPLDEKGVRHFSVFAPVYKNGALIETVEQRRAAVVGYVIGVFNSQGFLGQLTGERHIPAGLDVDVYEEDGDGRKRLLFDVLHREGEMTDLRLLRKEVTLDMAGRAWSVVFSATPEFGLSGMERIVPLAVLLAGLLTSILFGLLFRSVMLSRTRAVGLAEEMTRSLRDSEARFRAISDASPMGIFVTDTQGRCLYVNQAYAQIVGWALEGLSADGWEKAVHPEDREQVFGKWNACVAHPKNLYANIHRCVRQDGSLVWVSVKAAPIMSGNQFSGHVGTVEDITARVKTEEELHARLKDLEFMNRVMMDREERIVELKEEIARWRKTDAPAS